MVSCQPLILAACLAVLVPFGRALVDDEVHPSVAVIQKTADDVVELLESKHEKKEKERRFGRLIQKELDIDHVSRDVLGRNWPAFSESQKLEFKEVFVPYLVQKYWAKVESGKGLKITITANGQAEEGSDDYWRVSTKVVTDGSHAKVDFVLAQRSKDKAWKIIDIVVDDVSQVQTNRDEFNPIVGQKPDGPERLIKTIREKTKR